MGKNAKCHTNPNFGSYGPLDSVTCQCTVYSQSINQWSLTS